MRIFASSAALAWALLAMGSGVGSGCAAVDPRVAHQRLPGASPKNTVRPSAVIYHEAPLGGDYELVHARYYIDRRPVLVSHDHGGMLSNEGPVMVAQQDLVPGYHHFSVELSYRPKAGVFSYVDAYRYRLRGEAVFLVEKSDEATLHVFVERGSAITESFESRLRLKVLASTWDKRRAFAAR